MRRGSSASYPVSCHRFQSLVTVAIERRRAPRLLRQGGQPNLKRESFLIRLTKHGGRASSGTARGGATSAFPNPQLACAPPCIVGQNDVVCPTSVRRNSYTVFNRCWNFVKRRNLVSCGRPIVNRRAIFIASSFLTSRTNRLSHPRTFERRDDGPSGGRVLASGPRQDGSARPPGNGETRHEPPRSGIQGNPCRHPHAHAIRVRHEG